LLAGVALACTDDPTAVDLEQTAIAAAASSSIARTVINPRSLTVGVGGTATATCQPLDRDGNPLDRNCNWRSRDTTVATVTGSGTRTGTITGRKQGKVWIVASATSRRDSLSLTVGAGSPDDPSPTEPTPTEPTPTDPTPTDPTPTDPTPTDPTPPEPPPAEPLPTPTSAPTAGCPSSGYLRLVNVSSDAQLSSALSNAQPGDQIRLAAGNYSASRGWSRSGTAAHPITLCGLPGVRPVLLGTTFSSTGSYLLFTGLVFDGNRETKNVVYLHSMHDVVFSGNEIRNGRYHAGLSVDDMYNTQVIYNYVHDNGADASHDHGIYWKTTNGKGNLIANNLLVRNKARGISLHDNSGTGVYDVVVVHNTAVYNGSSGLLINNGDRNIVANNLFAYNGDLNNQKQIRIVGSGAQGISNGSNHQIRNNLTYSTTASRAGIANEAGAVVSGNVIADAMLMGAGDLRLQTGSPAIGLGLSTYTWGKDYDGRTRDASPDAGAYEQ
jgi:cell division septation protein DedD